MNLIPSFCINWDISTISNDRSNGVDDGSVPDGSGSDIFRFFLRRSWFFSRLELLGVRTGSAIP